ASCPRRRSRSGRGSLMAPRPGSGRNGEPLMSCMKAHREAWAMAAIDRKNLWRYMRGLAGPVLLWGFVILTLREPLRTWLHAEEEFDQAAMKEWIKQSPVFRLTLPELVSSYQREVADYCRIAETNFGNEKLSQQ